MKIEEQDCFRIDSRNVLFVWTDIDTGEKRYEVQGQTFVNVKTPQGVSQAPVHFKFEIEAKNIQQAAEQFDARLKEEADKAARQFVDNLNAQQRKIQVAREDQIIQLRSDRMKRNGSL